MSMKNKYLTFGVFLAILIFLLSALTVRYYNHKKELYSNLSDGIIDNNNNSDNRNNSDDDVSLDNIATEHLGKNSGEVGLKTPTTFEEFDALAMRDADALFVFGRTGCGYCEQYYPVLQEVAEEQKVEIIYVNLADFSKEDYATIIESDITIPGKCVNDGVDRKIGGGFGTPLSLYMNKYETYDCIRGYKNKKDLLKSMKKAGYIK